MPIIFLLFSFTYFQLQATTPPSPLEHADGVFLPPTPCLIPPPPLSRSNARWRGYFSDHPIWHHHHPSLTRRRGPRGRFSDHPPFGTTPPSHVRGTTTTPPLLEREMEGYFSDHPVWHHHHPFLARTRDRGAVLVTTPHLAPPLHLTFEAPPPPSLDQT